MKKLLALLILLVGVFALAACGGDDEEPVDEETDQDRVEEAVDRSGALFVDTGSVTTSISLPMTIMGEVTVTWESNNTEVIEIQTRDDEYFMNVTRPGWEAEDEEVIITATFTLNDVEETRIWTLNVSKEPQPTVFTTIADLHEESVHNDIVEINGIVVALYRGGFIIYDGEDFLNVYTTLSGLKDGDRVRVLGTYDNYHSASQIARGATINILESGVDYTIEPTDISLEDINNLDATEEKTVASGFYRVKGKAEHIQGERFKNWHLTDGDLSVQLYHEWLNDSETAFSQFENQEITVNFFYYSNHSTNGVLVLYYDAHGDVEVDLTDSEKIDLAYEALDIDFKEMILKDITLPETGSFETSITWESSHPEVITNDGTVIRPETETTVTLTATISLNEDSKEKVIELTVKAADFEPMTIADALAAEDGDIVYLKGVVNAYREFNHGVFIEDEAGDIIYVTNIVAEAGNEIIVMGTRGTYDSHGNDRPEVGSPVLVSNDEGDNPYTVVTTATMEDIADGFPLNVGTRFRVENVEFIEFGGDRWSEVKFKGNDDTYIFFDIRNYGDRDAIEALSPGDIIDFIEFTTADLFYDNIRVDGVVLPDSLMPSED